MVAPNARTASIGLILMVLGWLCVIVPFLDPTLVLHRYVLELFLGALMIWLTGIVSEIDAWQSARGKLMMALNGLSILIGIVTVVWALHMMAEAG